MAVRGWGGAVATAIGVAAGAGAAQLGLGYGLGVIAWIPSTDATGEAAWVAGLAWATWIAATATVAGAVCAARLARPGPDGATADPSAGPALASGLWRITLALASAVGAVLTVALVAVPARAATRADTFSPQTIAAGYAVLGVLLGLLAAIWALSSPAVANNIVATVAWLWLIAVVAVIHAVISGRGIGGAQLGVWQITSDGDRYWFRNYFYWPGAALSLGSALVIGALTARSAARRSAHRVGTTISGGAGPLLVAVAYFLAAPRLVGIRAEQVSAHLAAPYAVIAGVAGSVLVAALAQRADRRPVRVDPAGTPVAADSPSSAPAPVAEPALPSRAGSGDSGAAPGKDEPAGFPRQRVPEDEPAGFPRQRVPEDEPAGFPRQRVPEDEPARIPTHGRRDDEQPADRTQSVPASQVDGPVDTDTAASGAPRSDDGAGGGRSGAASDASRSDDGAGATR
ncbi:hypothetical protein [Plantactinospora sp. GCM10030261]|uniref:hypothetical protein n=1 Tax=Plantactinospora sp. GCM10030261 TaxID=3273420 RepID=UPI003612805F